MSLPRVAFVACHRRPDRSLRYRGRQFPVCARCTGILVGYLTYPLFLFDFVALPVWLALLANLPALLDGTTQALGGRESTNPLRLATGVLSGTGQVALMSWAGRLTGNLILTLLRG